MRSDRFCFTSVWLRQCMRSVVLPNHPLQPTRPQSRCGRLNFGAETEEKGGRLTANFRQGAGLSHGRLGSGSGRSIPASDRLLIAGQYAFTQPAGKLPLMNPTSAQESIRRTGACGQFPPFAHAQRETLKRRLHTRKQTLMNGRAYGQLSLDTELRLTA